MVKKILFLSAIMAATTSIALAGPAPYVGASIGLTTNTSSGAATSNIINGATVVQSQPANFRGVPFNVFVGYGGLVSPSVYLAGELFGTIGTAELSNNNGLKSTYGLGASFIPGVLLSDHTMAFARLGVVRSRFPDNDATSTGGQIGVGLQTSVTQNIDLRGEYDYTNYRSFNNKYGRVSAPRADTFNVGLVYKFD